MSNKYGKLYGVVLAEGSKNHATGCHILMETDYTRFQPPERLNSNIL